MPRRIRLNEAGFATYMDLGRHLQAEHGYNFKAPFRGYASATDICTTKDKVWLNETSFLKQSESADSWKHRGYDREIAPDNSYIWLPRDEKSSSTISRT